MGVQKESGSDALASSGGVVVIVPAKGYDAKQELKEGWCLDCREVEFTYPKAGVDLSDELASASPALVISVGGMDVPAGFNTASAGRDGWRKAAAAVPDRLFNYHHHDEYSMRDALGSCVKLSEFLKAGGRKFLSVTNHGSIGGWIKQNNACRNSGIKSVFGMEAYVSQSRDKEKRDRSANHLILIASTEEGLGNIIRIHNDAQLNGFYYSPRTCDGSLSKWGKGIIATSACAKGEIPELLSKGEKQKARERYFFYKSVFDEFYIELQMIEMDEQRRINRLLVEFGKEVGAEFTIGLDSHYLYPEHSETHDLLMCIRQGRTVKDTSKEDDDTWQFDVKNLYYRDYGQARDIFDSGFVRADSTVSPPFRDDVFTDEIFEQACLNTRRIAVFCEDIKMPSDIKLPKMGEDSREVLRKEAWAGFLKKGLDAKPNADEYRSRLEYELDVITLSGWADYFLITKLIIDKAREMKGEFATGSGRGSAAGSLVSWVLMITGIDPLEYGLLFERFLDYSRSEIVVNAFEL